MQLPLLYDQFQCIMGTIGVMVYSAVMVYCGDKKLDRI